MIFNIKNIFKLNFIKSDSQEKEQLNSWNQEQYENLKSLLQTNNMDEKIASLKDYRSYDKKRAFEKITGESYINQNTLIQNSYFKYAAAASVLLILSFAFLYLFKSNENRNQQYATTNEKTQITLPDESFVTLDKNSTLTYNSNREVTLNGRAYFNVTKDAKNPFVVNISKGKVTVLGTKFTVWSDANNVEVSVEEGKVKYDFDGRSILLEHKQWMKLVNNDIVSSSISSSNQFSWKQETLIFKDTPIDIVLNDLTRHYGISIRLDDSINKKQKCLLTSSYKDESIEQVLAELKTLFDLSIIKKSNEYVITAINCK